MRHYLAMIKMEPNLIYVLNFPDLPGCLATANDWNEIPAKAQAAMDAYFSETPLIEPRPLNKLHGLSEVRAAVMRGAALMLVPYIASDGTQVRANISLDRGLLRAIDETAKARQMTRSAFLGSLARREITGV